MEHALPDQMVNRPDGFEPPSLPNALAILEQAVEQSASSHSRPELLDILIAHAAKLASPSFIVAA